MTRSAATPALVLLGAMLVAALARPSKPARPMLVFAADRHVFTRPEGAGWLKRSGNTRYHVHGDRMEMWERPDGLIFFNPYGARFWLERRGSGPLMVVRPHTCTITPPPFRRTFKTKPGKC